MRIHIGSDHAGYKKKEQLKKWLYKKGHDVVDAGTESEMSVDYPDYAKKVADAVVKDHGSRGILICGSGTGMVIAANKVKGIRAAMAYDNYSAKMARVDNDTNVLCLRARGFYGKKNEQLAAVWLKTPFSGKARHKKRIAKISRMER